MCLKNKFLKFKEKYNKGGFFYALKITSFYFLSLFFPENISKKRIQKIVNKINPTILEIGAHIGQDTEEFLKIFEIPTIYCFEPLPENVNILIKKFKNNKNIKVEKLAISNKDGYVDFYLSEFNDHHENPASSSIKKPLKHLDYFPDILFKKKIIVKSMTLDNWVQKNNVSFIDFIWMDIQGAEKEMILGAKKTLNYKTKYLYTEFSNKKLYEGESSLTEIKKLLPSYKVVKVFGFGRVVKNVLLKNTNL